MRLHFRFFKSARQSLNICFYPHNSTATPVSVPYRGIRRSPLSHAAPHCRPTSHDCSIQQPAEWILVKLNTDQIFTVTMGTKDCVLECQTCDHKVAGSNLGRGYFVLCTKVNSALRSVRGEMATLADWELNLGYDTKMTLSVLYRI